MSERGRFAPSPTGELHLGNARTALLSWLWSRQEGAGYALRIEDIDKPRVRPGMAEQQLEELRWLGLDWDGPPVFQSARTADHEAALRRLADHVYQCFCSRAEIAAASAPHGDEGPRYPGTCANLTRAQREERRRTRPPSLRLRGQREPRGAHAPLLIAANGERLSKRDQSLSLSALRARGVDPRQVVAHLARLSGIKVGDGAWPRNLIKLFSLSKVPHSPVAIRALPY